MEPEESRNTQRYRFADLELCVGERRLSRHGEAIALSKLSFEFLLALLEAAPNLVSHETLAARVWGRRRIVTTENLAKRALMLRQALGDHADHPKYFEVVRGQGYRLLPPVEAAPLPPPSSQVANRPAGAWLRARLGALAAAGAALAVLFAYLTDRFTDAAPAAAGTQPMRVELATDPDWPLVGTRYSRDVAISPDGSTLAYVSRDNSIVVRRLDNLESRRITGLGTDVRNPSFSPDGHHLAFLDGGALKRVPAANPGPVGQLANVGQFTDGDIGWARDGSILVANSRGLLRVSADGGAPETLLTPDTGAGERAFSTPGMLPDERTVVFSIEPTEATFGSRIAAWNMQTGRKTYLLNNAIEPTFLAPGYLAYVAESQLRVARFDTATLSLDDAYAVLADEIRVHGNGTAAVDVADDGAFVYIAGPAPPVRDLVWVDREGRTQALATPAMNYTYPRLSPQGSHILLDVRWPESDIWVWDVIRQSMLRVTHDPAENALPVWHPDGRHMAFGDGRDGFSNVFWHALNSGAEPEPITDGERRQLPFSISPDGRHLLIGEDQPDGHWNMRSLELDSHTQSELLSGPFSYWNTDFSPDGRWIVYQSDESGALEVYVRPFPDTQGGRWQISRAGGSKPQWSRDGHEIFYIEPDGWLVAVAVRTDNSFDSQSVSRLFDTKKIFDQPYESGARPYDLSVTDSRFLFVRNVVAESEQRRRLIVGFNTAQLIERL